MGKKPILFSGAMVEAILEGRKTQTRRIVKGDPNGKVPFTDELPCPYGLTSDTLWVREKWNAQTQSGKWWHEVKREDRPLLNWAWTNPVKPAFEAVPPRWLPSIHMPREACRIELEIVKLKIERLQNITRDDAKAEGVSNIWNWTTERNPDHHSRGVLNPYVANYSVLWDEIHAGSLVGDGWNANPWVWVIEFKRLETVHAS